MDIQSMPQPGSTPAPVPSQQPTVAQYAPEQNKPKPWLKIILTLVILIILGGGAYAAYYFQVWPFSLMAPNKEQALLQAVTKMQDMTSGRYNSSLTVTSETRDTSRPSMKEVFAEDNGEMEGKFERDNDRLRVLRSILEGLKFEYTTETAYPEDVNDYFSDTQISSDFLVYSRQSEGQSFSLSATFELPEAANAVKRGISTATVEDKTATITADGIKNKSYFSFYLSQPKSMYEELFGDGDELAEYIPSDFSFSINASGLTLKDKEATDFEFQLGGQVNAGDLIAAVEGELRKIGDNFYGKINKIPSLYFDISELKQKWVEITKEDIVSTNSYSSFPRDFLEEGQDKSKQITRQLFDVLKLALEQGVVKIDYDLDNQMIGEKEFYVYKINIQKDKFYEFYQQATDKLKESYNDKAIWKKDAEQDEFFQSEKFTRLMTYLDANAEFLVSVNKTTGFLEIFDYKLKLIPGGEGKLGEKQLAMDFQIKMSDINMDLKVEKPSEFMTFEDAAILMSGMSKEEYRFNKQSGNISSLRSALGAYYSYTGTYPDNLEILTKKRSEVTPKMSLNNEDCLEFDCYDQYSYMNNSEYYLNRPFISHIPKDIFTKQEFSYTKATDDYTLTYSMTIPTREQLLGDTSFGRTSVNDLMGVVEGNNTANKKIISIEAVESLKIDSDGDELPDMVENYYGSAVNNVDSDDDGFYDGDEVKKGYDPMGPGKLDYYETWYSSNYYDDYYYEPLSIDDTNIESEVTPPTLSSADHQRGANDAKVNIIVYTDFQCPFCKNYHDTLNKVLTDYPTEVKVVYKHFPLTSIHTYAQRAAEATECADDQGKFWEYVDKLFANQSLYNNDYFSTAAEELGLNKTTFDSCLSSNKYASKVSKDYLEAISFGFQGTPASFVGTVIVNGAQPYEIIKNYIDDQLK